MNCDPNALLEAAKCFRCIPRGEMGAVMIYLYCQWLKKKVGPEPAPFKWLPESAVLTWTDSGGSHTGNYSDFLAIVASTGMDTVDTIVAESAGITEFQNIFSLTGLTNFDCIDNPLITSLDFSNCSTVQYLSCENCSITSLNLSGCASLAVLFATSNNLTSLDVSQCTLLVNLYCSNNSLASVVGLSALSLIQSVYLDINSLDQSSVDSVLCQLDAGGVINGYANVSVNASPGAPGLACINNLTVKGWEVIHS